MLRALSSQTHWVISVVAVGRSGFQRTTMTKTRVEFRKIQDVELSAYLKSGEWKDKAGAYAIQGKALGFASRIVGSLTGVVGLPLKETLGLIEKAYAQPPF
jgi:septum formation protein